MQKNIGAQDRFIRAAIGVGFLVLAWWFSSWILLALSIFSFYEALVGWCVLYQLIGKNSCPLE